MRAPFLRLPLLTIALAGAPAAAQEQGRTLDAVRVSRPPALEDYLSGAVVSRDARELGPVWIEDFRQRDPGDGTPASAETAAYVTYDEANLYVVFVCRDDPTKVRARIAKREGISGDDAVLVYLDTFHDRQRAYLFMTNPRGVQLDGIITEGQSDNYSFDAVWHSEGRLTETGYAVRLVIPFRSLRFSSAPSQTWGIALGRIIRRNNEKSYWPYITKRVKGFVPQFGALRGLTDISPGRNIQFSPYTTMARARFLDQDVPAFRSVGDRRVGLDAKVVLHDALTVDATLNPDFSQVETDDPQVTVNQRFEVFFPEKRPFFIENAGYFETPLNLLFSRRIVDPGAGIRVTGKVGRWAVGGIAINDREPGRVPSPDPLAGSRAGVGALRVQREIGKESTVGLLITDRELDGSRDRALSVDTRWKLGRNWALTGQLVQSDSRALNGERSSGVGALARLDRDGRHFDYSGSYLQLDPEFTTALGFVPRSGIRQTEQKWQYRWRPAGRAVLNYGPAVNVLFVWDPAGVLQDRELAGEFAVELRGASEIKLERTEAFELFDGLRFRPHRTKATLASEVIKWVAADASYEWGTAVNHDPAAGLDPFLGRAAETEVKLTLRPTPRLRIDNAYIHSRLNTGSGRRVFTERLLRGKVNYQFSRALSVRMIVDYKAEGGDTTLADVDDERRWRGDLLLTYLVNPGTALYVGYFDNYQNLGLVGSPPTVERRRLPDTSTGRQLFAKVSYLLQF